MTLVQQINHVKRSLQEGTLSPEQRQQLQQQLVELDRQLLAAAEDTYDALGI